jgi:hypothetical protein
VRLSIEINYFTEVNYLRAVTVTRTWSQTSSPGRF